jgi:hypothetical protein
MQNPYLASLEIEPNSSLSFIKMNRKKILKKLHPDNKKTGNSELFQHANEFYESTNSSYKFNLQKRNLYTIGKSIKKEYRAEDGKVIYNLVQDTAVKISMAMIGFSFFNLFFLLSSYKTWSRIFFMVISLILLIVPIAASFFLKITLMNLVNPYDFRSELWKTFLYYLHISNSIFPSFSLQELEHVVLHNSIFWLVCLAISLPKNRDNLVKDLIETHKEVKKLNQGQDIEITEVFMKVQNFVKKYQTSSFWQKIKKCSSFFIPFFFLLVLPYMLKE